MTFSIVVSQAWWTDMRSALGSVIGTLAIFGIAWLPGYLYAQLLASVLLDRRPPLPTLDELPATTVVVAVFNEEDNLTRTVECLLASNFNGPLTVLIADDGSTDGTLALAYKLSHQHPQVRVIGCGHGGKHHALNTALATIDTPIVCTVDADTLVEPGALAAIVSRLIATPGCVAVAGSLLVTNDDESLVARMQGWEYRLSIAAVKRQQAMFGATLVAQGAFSAYGTRAVLAQGGWPDAIGEDILVTWQLIDDGGQIEFEPTAFARTSVPTTLRAFARQRRRWARGMVEGLRANGATMLRARRWFGHGVIINYLLPLIDAAYVFIFVPGLIAAIFFNNYLVAGPMTVAMLPMAFLLFAVMGKAGRDARKTAGITVERQWSGFIAYLTFYRVTLAFASLYGYAQELRRARRDW
jgi:biofilm PGA synthesis N-glycosyltransferase PgaC